MKKLFDDDVRPSIEQMRKTARRITAKEHARWHSRMGRPPVAKSERYIPTYIKLHPRVMAWARAQAKRRGIGYQTVINQTLLRKAA